MVNKTAFENKFPIEYWVNQEEAQITHNHPSWEESYKLYELAKSHLKQNQLVKAVKKAKNLKYNSLKNHIFKLLILKLSVDEEGKTDTFIGSSEFRNFFYERMAVWVMQGELKKVSSLKNLHKLSAAKF